MALMAFVGGAKLITILTDSIANREQPQAQVTQDLQEPDLLPTDIADAEKTDRFAKPGYTMEGSNLNLAVPSKEIELKDSGFAGNDVEAAVRTGDALMGKGTFDSIRKPAAPRNQQRPGKSAQKNNANSDNPLDYIVYKTKAAIETDLVATPEELGISRTDTPLNKVVDSTSGSSESLARVQPGKDLARMKPILQEDLRAARNRKISAMGRGGKGKITPVDETPAIEVDIDKYEKH